MKGSKMKKMTWIIAVLFLVIFSSSFARDNKSPVEELPEVTKEYKAEVLKMFEVLKYKKELEMTKKKAMERIFSEIESLDTKDSAEALNQISLDELIDKQCRLYSKYFSIDEIKELTILFASPIYKKMNSIGEELSYGLYNNENSFFDEVLYRTAETLEKKGYEIPPQFVRPNAEEENK